MKFNVYRILTILLAVVILVSAAAFSVAAVNKKTTTQDGLYVVFTTDKDAYTADETIKAGLQIINNAAAKVDLQTKITFPASIQVASGSAEQSASIEVGSVWDADEVTLKYEKVEGPAGSSGGGWLVAAIIAGVVVVAAVVLLLIFGKNLKSHVSILLLFAMLFSFVAMAVPTEAAPVSNSLDVINEITVDGEIVELKATVTYTIAQVEEEDEEVDDGRLVAFYYNDFEDPDRWIQDGATLNYGDDQLIDSAAEADGKNHYGYIQIKNSTSAAYVQADLKESRPVDHMVVRMELSTGSFVPKNSYVQYRYNKTTNQMLLYITQDGRIQIGKTVYDDIRVEKDKWLKIEFLIDFTDPNKDMAQVYVNDKKLTDLELLKSEENYPIPYIRFTVAGNDSTGASVGGSLWLDNIAVYEGAERLPMDKMKSPKLPTGERRTIAPDVEMIHPELSDLGKDAIVVLGGSVNAFADGALVKMSAKAELVTQDGEITDVKVPGAFLSKYLGATGLKDTQMYSLKEYAGDKNVVIDSRGLVVITPKELDAEKDIKLLTMLYGYLKTGELASNYATAPMFTQEVIDEAFTTIDAGFGPYSGTSNQAMKNMNAIYYLTLATYMDKNTKASDGSLAKDEAVQRIKRLISGGREPNATVGCFWEQSIVGSILVLAKNTPAIWNELTAEEHGKMDLLMECLAIASNWGHNAGNDYSTGLDLLGNYGKDYNPNFKNASFVNYLNGSMYFGAEKLDEIYTSFDYDKYIGRLKKAGFTNIIAQWTNQDLFGVSIGEYLTHGGEVLFEGDGVPSVALPGNSAGTGVGVKVPWKYEDIQNKAIYDRDDWFDMLFDHIDYTYGLAVISTNGIPGSMTYSYIMSGKTSPHAGKMGMLMEFSSVDGGGYTRSKCMYCYLSVQVMVGLYANLKLLGLWNYEDQTPEVAKRMREMDSRMMVGNEDLFFKLQEGYMGNSQQKSAEEHAEEFVQFGLKFVEDIWYNFHAMNNDPVDIVEKEEIKFLQPAATSKDGITDAPKDAWIPRDSDPSGFMHNEAEYEIDGKCYLNGTLEFDLTIGDEMQEAFNGVIMFGQSHFGLTNYADHSMLIALKNGDIYVYNEDEYAATGIKFGPNYKFHFKVDFNCTTKRYDVTVTQTWPKTDKPVTATVKDMWFRNTYAVKYVDTFQMTSQAMMDEFWVENAKISGTTRAKTDYTPYRELSVKLDWGEVPASKRPSSVKVNLVYNGKTIQHKYVTLTKQNGWTASFDHVPLEINKRVAEYSVYLEPVAGYLAIPSEIDKNNVITVVQTTRPVIYDNDFQEETLGKMTDNSGPYNMGVAQIVTEGKNKFLSLNDSNNLEHQMGLMVDGMFIDGKLNNLYSMIFFEMDIKKASPELVVGGYALGYRQARSDDKPGTASHNLVSVVSNSIRVLNSEKAYTIGNLTDEWQHLKVCLDIENRRALVFYGSDTNYILIDNLPEVMSNSFHISTWKNQHGLAVDNMKVYCDASLNLDSILNDMTTTLTVETVWSKDVSASRIPDSVKAYLVVNGELTDKFATLTKKDGWKAKAFDGLKVLVNGEKQSYSAMLSYVPEVVTSTTAAGNSVIFTSYAKYTYFDSDFTVQKTEPVGVSQNVYDKAGNALLMSTGTPTFKGKNPYWVYTNSTSSVMSSVMQDARNVILSMRLKADKFVDGGMFSVRYKSGEDTRKVIFEATCKDNIVAVKFFERAVATMTAGQWMDITFMFDKENNICRIKVNDGDWVEAQGCADNTGDYIRFYANQSMKWGIDDLKVYSDGSWTAEKLPQSVNVGTQVDWTDGTPGKSSLTMQLYCNGAAVEGKTLKLSAANNWKGTFKNLPTRDTFGNKLSYTVKQMDTLKGYNTYYTGAGTILHHTKNTYYYWNDFTNKSMTDDNGVVPSTVTGPVSFLGTENVYAGYRGTFTLSNAKFKTASNITVSMKLRLEEIAKGALYSMRYCAAENARYPFFEISINSDGSQANVKLAGVTLMSFAAQKWYDFTIVFDQQRSKVVLYCDGKPVGTPVDCPKNIGEIITLYANNIDWQTDDFRVYTNNKWNGYADFRTDVQTTLTWDDMDDVDGKRPASVTVTLLADGISTGKTASLNAAGQWKATFTDLAMYHAETGKKVVYTVSAAATDYTATYSGTAITMHIDLSDKQIDKTVTVKWDDSDDAASRPAELTLQLYRDGAAVAGKTLTVKASEGWTATFKDIPMGDAYGKRFVYTVKPVETLSGYNLYYTGAGNILNLTRNTYYYWNDFTNESMTDDNGVIPNTVTGPLGYAQENDNIYLCYKQSFGLINDSFRTANNLIVSMKLRVDAGAKGSLYSLRYVSENNSNYPLFQVRVNGTGTDAWFELAGTRVKNFSMDRWYDITITYDQQRDKVLFYCDGQIVGTILSCEQNVGNAIKLYGSGTDWQMDDFRIYTDTDWNCYSDFRTDVETTLTWDDLNNVEGKRPADVTVALFADGVTTGKTVTLNEAGQWKATFTDLPEYNEQTGNKVVYTVSAAATGYIAKYNGTAITMLVDLSGVTVDKSVTVQWDDEDDVQHRPTSLTLQLYKDGTAVDGKTQTATAAGNWAASFNQLQKYNLQTRLPNEYTISVVRIPGYMAMYQNGIIVMVKGISFDIRLIDGAGMAAIAD